MLTRKPKYQNRWKTRPLGARELSGESSSDRFSARCEPTRPKWLGTANLEFGQRAKRVYTVESTQGLYSRSHTFSGFAIYPRGREDVTAAHPCACPRAVDWYRSDRSHSAWVQAGQSASLSLSLSLSLRLSALRLSLSAKSCAVAVVASGPGRPRAARRAAG